MSTLTPCPAAVEEKLTAYLLGDLPADEAVRVREHLAGCASCQAMVRDLEPALTLLRDTLSAPAAQAHALEPARRRAVRAALTGRPARRPLLAFLRGHPAPDGLQPLPYWPLLIRAAALVAVIVTIGVLMRRSAPPDTGTALTYRRATEAEDGRHPAPEAGETAAATAVATPQDVAAADAVYADAPGAASAHEDHQRDDGAAGRPKAKLAEAKTTAEASLADARPAEREERLGAVQNAVATENEEAAAPAWAALPTTEALHAPVPRPPAAPAPTQPAPKPAPIQSRPAAARSMAVRGEGGATAQGGTPIAGMAVPAPEGAPAVPQAAGTGLAMAEEPTRAPARDADGGRGVTAAAGPVRNRESGGKKLEAVTVADALTTARKLQSAPGRATTATLDDYVYGYPAAEQTRVFPVAEAAPSPFRPGLHLLRVGFRAPGTATDPGVPGWALALRLQFNPDRVLRYRRAGATAEDYTAAAEPAVTAFAARPGQEYTVAYEVELHGDPQASLGTVRITGPSPEFAGARDLTAADLRASFAGASVGQRVATLAVELQDLRQKHPAVRTTPAQLLNAVRDLAAAQPQNEQVEALLHAAEAAAAQPVPH